MMMQVGDIGLGIVIGFVACFFLIAWMAEREERADEEMRAAAGMADGAITVTLFGDGEDEEMATRFGVRYRKPNKQRPDMSAATLQTRHRRCDVGVCDFCRGNGQCFTCRGKGCTSCSGTGDCAACGGQGDRE